MIRVGFQGKHGTFSDVAVDGFFKGQDIEKVSFTDFYSIITAVENEDIDYQSEVLVEGMNVSIPLFLLCWIMTYTMNKAVFNVVPTGVNTDI